MDFLTFDANSALLINRNDNGQSSIELTEILCLIKTLNLFNWQSLARRKQTLGARDYSSCIISFIFDVIYNPVLAFKVLNAKNNC